MNKYQEEFDLVRRLCQLDGRERTILNYGIEEGRAKAIDEVMEVVKSTYHNFCGFDLGRMTKYGNEDAGQQEQSYSTMMMYEISYEFEDLIDALEQLKEGGKE